MRKIVQHPILYLEDQYHQLNLENYLLEVNSIQFFRKNAINASNVGGYHH